MDKINPNKRYLNSMVVLIFGLFCLSCTLVSMSTRYGNSMLYELLKQVQLFTLASVGGEESGGDLDLKPLEIETRRDLVNYLEIQVPNNFFYSQASLDAG